jgi:membrane protein YqaA with SNARE-associated domain
MIRAAESPYAVWILAFVSFAESSFFPLAPDFMLVPMAVARPKRAFFYAGVCAAASVLGGIAGYGIGYFLFESVGQTILNFYGYEDQFLHFAGEYNQHGFWLVFASGLTPLPYKIFTIASGVTHLNLGVFIGASCASRGLRYFVEALAIWKFGDRIHMFLERRVGLVLSVALGCLIGGFFLLKYVF